MILQRLAYAIRQQNWSQITIEILIVVIGIFLGLQVQSWYETVSYDVIANDRFWPLAGSQECV